jgi:predicted transcriptional regulator of viral defense system
MRGIEERILQAAAAQRFLISRGEVFELGGSEYLILDRLRSGRWLRIHDGVYQVDRRPLSWESKLMAALLACGPGALVSHRAAMVLWGLDGISSAPVEITMPFGNLGFPEGAIIHRTRRDQEPAEVRGIPVTTVERTLLSCAA